ncbi:MAG: ABC transporter ATP-binding protein [bacterium]|nr:ABC transporter ATP-binding protein [bacterium]
MSTGPILEARGLAKTFTSRRSMGDVILRRPTEELQALEDVSFQVVRGESLGIVGESGCGKSTLARCLVGLYPPTAGQTVYEGRTFEGKRSFSDRKKIQIVFQDPYSSLNARMTIGQALREVLRVHKVVASDRVPARAVELLALVGLDADIANVYPRQLSGGQRQRVNIARALAVEPEVLIADEPVSALDVSIQATVLNLLASLRERLGLTLILIAHDLSVVRYLCDRVAVMYMGRIVEIAATEELFEDPCHPYTQALLAAAPSLERKSRDDARSIGGDPPSPFDLPEGCPFHPRCPRATDHCATVPPPLEIGPGDSVHRAACHYAWAPVAPHHTPLTRGEENLR